MKLNYQSVLTEALIIIAILGFSNEAANVAVKSNLNIGATAFDNQIVTFECTIKATGSVIILSWSGDDYVGPGGALLQVASVHDPGRTATSPVNPNTVATLINVTTDPDTGVTEVVSSLRITASAQYPTSSVSCHLDNHGTPNTIIFSVIPPNVAVTSNLNIGATAFFNQIVTFECTIKATGSVIILSWSSDDYVGPEGALLQVASVQNPGRNATSPVNPNTVATLINVTTNPDTGVTEVVSHLRITASEQHLASAVSCRLDNNGTPKTITFSIAQSGVTLSHNLTDGKVYDNQTVTFICVVESTSPILTWRSDVHIGPGSAIEFTDDEVATQRLRSTTTATLINATTNMSTGVTVMKSVLNIVASMKFPNSSVSCESLGVINITRFWTIPRSTDATVVGNSVTTLGNPDDMLNLIIIAVVAVTPVAVILIAVAVGVGVLIYLVTYRKYKLKGEEKKNTILQLELMVERGPVSGLESVVVHKHCRRSCPTLYSTQQPIKTIRDWRQGQGLSVMFDMGNTVNNYSQGIKRSVSAPPCVYKIYTAELDSRTYNKKH